MDAQFSNGQAGSSGTVVPLRRRAADPFRRRALERPRNTIAFIVFGVAAVGSISVLAIWNHDKTQGAIQRLPPADRGALFKRTLQTLESACVSEKRPPGLEDFCQSQAEFVVQFPECDARCTSLARQQLRLQTR